MAHDLLNHSLPAFASFIPSHAPSRADYLFGYVGGGGGNSVPQLLPPSDWDPRGLMTSPQANPSTNRRTLPPMRATDDFPGQISFQCTPEDAPYVPPMNKPSPSQDHSAATQPRNGCIVRGDPYQTRAPRTSYSSASTLLGSITTWDNAYSPPNSRTAPSSHCLEQNSSRGYNQDRYPAFGPQGERLGIRHASPGTSRSQGSGDYYPPRTYSVDIYAQNQRQMTPSDRSSYQYEESPSPVSDEDVAMRAAFHNSRLPSHSSSSSARSSQQPQQPPYGTNDPGEILRVQLNLPPGAPVNLDALQDPTNPGDRPVLSLPMLVKVAIYGSPRQQMTLQEIFGALEYRFQYFRDKRHEKAWKNSIRHALSLHKVFRHVSRPFTEPGKGKYWTLDYSQGEGNKRERKRKGNKPKSVDARTANGSPSMPVADEDMGSDSDGDGDGDGEDSSPSSNHADLEDSLIDPALRDEGHQVNGQRAGISRQAYRTQSAPSYSASQEVYSQQHFDTAIPSERQPFSQGEYRQSSQAVMFGQPSLASVPRPFYPPVDGYAQAMGHSPQAQAYGRATSGAGSSYESKLSERVESIDPARITYNHRAHRSSSGSSSSSPRSQD